jgi:hypothetical protein
MIIPSSKYPSQIDTTDPTNYPRGKARNVTASGDGTGTPFERDWINDWFGFQQAAIVAAGITPSGTPDTAVVSELLSALRTIIVQRPFARYVASGTKNNPTPFTLAASLTVAPPGLSWILASDAVQVPVAGKYRVAYAGQFSQTVSATNPSIIGASVLVGGATTGVGGNSQTLRYSATTGDVLMLNMETAVTITTPASQQISLAPLSGLTNILASANLIIEQIG